MWVMCGVHHGLLSLWLGVQVRDLAVAAQPLPLMYFGKTHLHAL